MPVGCADRLDFNPTHLNLLCLLILVLSWDKVHHSAFFYKSTRYFENQRTSVKWHKRYMVNKYFRKRSEGEENSLLVYQTHGQHTPTDYWRAPGPSEAPQSCKVDNLLRVNYASIPYYTGKAQPAWCRALHTYLSSHGLVEAQHQLNIRKIYDTFCAITGYKALLNKCLWSSGRQAQLHAKKTIAELTPELSSRSDFVGTQVSKD